MISFEVVTLFPDFFSSPLKESILRRAQEKGLISVRLHNIKNYTNDKHHTTDDYPYGGGVGMVLKPEPVVKALEKAKSNEKNSFSILLTPQGVPFSQTMAKQLINYQQIILVCGRYEGADERVGFFVDQEISIGDYVLTGGELAAMVLVDVVIRMLPGVLGCEDSARKDSFFHGALLDYPQYTRPASFRGWKVPAVLLSGNHQEIERWRRRKMVENTLKKRPDLLERINLSRRERKFLEEVINEYKVEKGRK